MKNKVLFIVNSLKGGGAERVVCNLIRKNLDLGYKVDVITMYNEKYDDSFNENFNLHCLNVSKNKFLRLLLIVYYIYKFNILYKNISENKEYSLITSHLNFSDLIVSKSIIKNKSLYVIHSNYSINSNFFVKYLFKFIYSSKYLISVSEGLRLNLIKNFSIDKNYIKTIYNPIDYNNILNLSNERLKVDYKYLLFVGRLEKKLKKPERMLEIFKRGEFYKEFKLVFCGLGPEKKELEKKSQYYNIQDNVIFMGYQDNVYKFMKNTECLVLTSDSEGFPMVLIEALACGAKVVSSDCEYGPNEILLGDYKEFLVKKTDDIDEYIYKLNKAIVDYPTKKPIIMDYVNIDYVSNKYLQTYKNFLEVVHV